MDQDFTLLLPLLKSDHGSDEDRRIRGLASCETRDLQGEVVFQKGLDCRPLLTNGWINWDHRDGPENQIGVPLTADVVDNCRDHPVLCKASVDGPGLYIEGRLKKGLERADAVWYHLNHPETDRSLSWSLQGHVVDRDGPRLRKSVIKHIAITFQPIQQNAFAELVKSFTLSAAAPLLREAINGKLTSTLWGGCAEGRSCYKADGSFMRGLRGALDHLVLCKGESVADAQEYLTRLHKSRLFRML